LSTRTYFPGNTVQIKRMWIAAVAVLTCVAHAQETAGYVLKVQGTWTASPGAVTLQPGKPVAAGSRIESKDANRSITIAFLDGSAQTFTDTHTVESQHASATSGTKRMLEAVSKSLSLEKRSAVFGISRGSLTVRPSVLKQTGKRLDLGPAMGSLTSGAYTLDFTPAKGGDAVSAKCNFDPPSATSATVPLGPGAYLLRVASASGTPIGSATVLVASGADFEDKSAVFRAGLATVASWPSDTDPAAIQEFLTALLIGLQ
jgi:hypothetical protein